MLYLGNNLRHPGSTTTTIDTPAPLLESEVFKVRCASHQLQKKILRFVNTVIIALRLKNWAHYVLVDTYST
jgi:hypothetical protein